MHGKFYSIGSEQFVADNPLYFLPPVSALSAATLVWAIARAGLFICLFQAMYSSTSGVHRGIREQISPGARQGGGTKWPLLTSVALPPLSFCSEGCPPPPLLFFFLNHRLIVILIDWYSNLVLGSSDKKTCVFTLQSLLFWKGYFKRGQDGGWQWCCHPHTCCLSTGVLLRAAAPMGGLPGHFHYLAPGGGSRHRGSTSCMCALRCQPLP